MWFYAFGKYTHFQTVASNALRSLCTDLQKYIIRPSESVYATVHSIVYAPLVKIVSTILHTYVCICIRISRKSVFFFLNISYESLSIFVFFLLLEKANIHSCTIKKKRKKLTNIYHILWKNDWNWEFLIGQRFNFSKNWYHSFDFCEIISNFESRGSTSRRLFYGTCIPRGTLETVR